MRVGVSLQDISGDNAGYPRLAGRRGKIGCRTWAVTGGETINV